MNQQPQRHNWTEEDEVTALLLYKLKNTNNRLYKDLLFHITTYMDISNNSIKMKLGNIKYLDTNDGLSNCSNKSRFVFSVYNHYPADDLTRMLGHNVWLY